MKTDTIFYRLFQSFPSIFFELINHPPQEADRYQFASVEVKQLSFRIDGVFLPAADAREQPIYFVEVQFQSDARLYSRFFSEIFLYLDKTELDNNWRGAVILPRRSMDTGETERYSELLNSERVSRIYLDELGETSEQSLGITTIQLVVAREETAIEQGRELIERVKVEIGDEPQRRELLQLIETILVYKLPRISRREIEAMFSLSDLKQTRVYQEALEEGRQEGKQQGRQEGRQEGKLESVPFMLNLGATVEQIAEALGLDVEQVRQVAQQEKL
ncbi:MAG: Rpn family recombination-promoting nuclease/putative transposase [Kastovskya adunca ATA6-11-RM4]|nr:Rpn family recombination-promoting nuclease/putative transposase [Kastovskya adunca ATA6-11-RM4]